MGDLHGCYTVYLTPIIICNHPFTLWLAIICQFWASKPKCTYSYTHAHAQFYYAEFPQMTNAFTSVEKSKTSKFFGVITTVTKWTTFKSIGCSLFGLQRRRCCCWCVCVCLFVFDLWSSYKATTVYSACYISYLTWLVSAHEARLSGLNTSLCCGRDFRWRS